MTTWSNIWLSALVDLGDIGWYVHLLLWEKMFKM